MKNIYIYIFLALMVGCTSVQQKQPFLGKWYTIHKENAAIIEFQFYKDSLIINHELGRSSQKWKVNEDKIHLTHMKGMTNKEQFTYSYQLDESNGLLDLKASIEDNIVELPELTRAENIFGFFQKHIGFKINLPITETELKQVGFLNYLNFNIYAGYRNKELVVKTDFQTDLNNLENEVTKFKENSREEFKRFLRFNLIADKSITESQIDSIKELLMRTSIEKVYRTYKNKQSDYENNLNLFGKKE